MNQIKFTIYMTPQPKQRSRLARKDSRGNYLRKPHSYNPAATEAAEREVWAQGYNHRPRGPRPVGAVRLDLATYLPWPADLRPRVAKGATKTTRVGVDNRRWEKPIDSDPVRGPWPIRKQDNSPDVDNLAKLVSDAFNELFYKDDIQIIEERITKQFSTIPRIEVSVTYIAGMQG
jgi:Holliday junction resolvase RusA-like endonuclease